MMNSRTVGIALAVVIALIGTYLYLEAQEQAGSSVNLSVSSHHAIPPCEVHGVASTDPADVVEVTATIDGMDMEGYPDLEMEGSVNEFVLKVTEEMRGKTIIVTAIASDGTSTRTHIVVE